MVQMMLDSQRCAIRNFQTAARNLRFEQARRLRFSDYQAR